MQFSKHWEAVEYFKESLQADKEVQIFWKVLGVPCHISEEYTYIFKICIAQSPRILSTASGRI